MGLVILGEAHPRGEREKVNVASIIFGWPAVIVSSTLALGGIVAKSWRLALAGAAVAAPFALYLTMTPRFRWAALAYGAYLSAAYAVRTGRRDLALLAVLPFALLVVLVASAVLGQWGG